jgi:hypothetical protein
VAVRRISKGPNVTGYKLEVGYNSTCDSEHAWWKLVDTVQRIRLNTGAIAGEVARIEPGRFGDAELREFAAAYLSDGDFTLTIDEAHRCVRQMASGGAPAREIKEAMRRAFSRLVIDAMHQARIEVNLIVS